MKKISLKKPSPKESKRKITPVKKPIKEVKEPYFKKLKLVFKDILITNNKKAWRDLITFVKKKPIEFKKEFKRQYQVACKEWPEFKERFKIK